MPAKGSGRPIPVRFWEKVRKGGGCWLWTGNRHRRGYGILGLRREGKRTISAKAHRLSWEIHNGPIPAGMVVCHHCDNPPCVNPSHLFLGTQVDNIRDMVAKGRQRSGARPQNKAACERGHALTSETTWTLATGKRLCRECSRLNGMKWRHKKAGGCPKGEACECRTIDDNRLKGAA